MRFFAMCEEKGRNMISLSTSAVQLTLMAVAPQST